MGAAVAALELLRNELLLFAGVGLLLGGLDDLLLDLIYGTRRLWRALTVYTRIPRMTARDLPPTGAAGPIVIFVPAWDESAVIGKMLRGCLDKWRGEDVQIFVGAYPNDRLTIDAVAAIMAGQGGASVTLVVNERGIM